MEAHVNPFQALSKENGQALEANTMVDPLNEEDAWKVKLKCLPSNLRYAFLGSNSTYPMILCSFILDNDIEKLFDVLRKHTRVIGYTIILVI